MSCTVYVIKANGGLGKLSLDNHSSLFQMNSLTKMEKKIDYRGKKTTVGRVN